MKKIFIILLILLCFGCGKIQSPITLEEFQDNCDKNELYFYDISDNFKESQKVIQAGMASTSVWHIEFYIFNEEDDAIEAYESNKQNFLDVKKESTTFTDSDKSYNNKVTYSLTTNTTYYYISRIDETMIFVQVPVEYRGRVKKFHESLGY